MLEEPGILNLADFEARARTVMPNAQFEMVDGGFNDEITFKRTQHAFDSIALRPRYLVDVSHVDTSTTVLGHKIALPILPDPAGGHTRAHPEGGLATCRAAGAAGTIMSLSHAAGFTIEEVVAAATGPVWCQVFLLKDRGYMLEYVRRAEDAGCAALCVTVDTPSLEMDKEQVLRNPDPHMYSYRHANLVHTGADGNRETMDLRDAIDPTESWDDLDWLRSLTSLPMVVKGVLTAEDARLCVEHGASAVIVSTHGARLFDGTITSIEALPEVVDAVDGRCEVLIDGGFRRGIDVLKALALGARAVLIGRPVFYGLAVGGEEGVRTVFEILRRELEFAMAMCGKPTVSHLNRSMLVKVPTLYEAGGFAARWRTGEGKRA